MQSYQQMPMQQMPMQPQQQYEPSPYMQPQQQYTPSPYMQQTPVQQTAKSGLPGWVKGLIVVAIIVLIAYVLKLGPFAPAVVDAPLGGVVIPGTPSDKPILPGTSTPVQVGTSPPLNVNQVSSITFTKDTTNATPIPNRPYWRTFQIGEIKVFNAEQKVLTAADFTSAKYNDAVIGQGYARDPPMGYSATAIYDGNPNTFTHTDGPSPIQQVIVTLKNPTNISQLQVLNREDCCRDLLAGVKCELKKADGTLVKSFTLTADMVQNLVVNA